MVTQQQSVLKFALAVFGLFFLLTTVIFGDTTYDSSPGGNVLAKNDTSVFGIGSGTVGQTGEARYSYSMGAVQAVYNSEDGWRIGDVSSISRSTKWGAPTYTDKDIFTLNGQEIIPNTNSFGNMVGTYHTIPEGYIKIRYNNMGTIGSHWTVLSKDGTMSFYGTSIDSLSDNHSRILAIGRPNDAPMAWVLGETIDQQNNITMYNYLNDAVDGGYYLSSIVKAKRFGPENRYQATRLYYESKPSTKFNMRQGARLGDNRRVKTVVEVIGCDANGNGGQIICAYQINWTESAFAKTSLIASIRKYGSNSVVDENGNITGNSSMQPVIFEYAQAQNQLGFAQSQDWGTVSFIRQGHFCNYLRQTPLGGGTARVYLPKYFQDYDMIDMNGDGLLDMVFNHQDASSYQYVDVATNSGNGFGPYKRWLYRLDTSAWSIKNNYMHLWHSDAGDFVDGGASPIEEWETPDKQQEFTINRIFDINGDGKPDLVHHDENGQSLKVELNTGSGFGARQDWGASDFWKHLGETLFEDFSTAPSTTFVDFYDINGDGLPDKVADYDASSRNIDVCINNGHGFNAAGLYGYLPDAQGSFMNYLRKIDTSTSDWSSTTKQEIIDINGDGLPDKIHCEDANFYVMLNNGHGYEPTVTWVNPGWGSVRHSRTENNKNDTCVDQDLIDMNGDGLPDLVKVINGRIMVAFNNGNGFNAPIDISEAGDTCLRRIGSYTTTEGGIIIRWYQTKRDLVDINGDSLPDQVWIENGILKVALNNASKFPDRMLVKVNNEMGGSTEYTYKPVNKQNNNGYKFNTWVVDKVVASDGLGESLTNSYDYYNGLYDSQYRENRGFGKVIATDPTGNKTETYYNQDLVYGGTVSKVITKNANGAIYSYVMNSYENFAVAPHNSDYSYGLTVPRPGTGPALTLKAPKLIRQDTYLADGSTTVDAGTQPGGSAWKKIETVYAYDNYGNPLTIENMGEVNPDGSDKGCDKTKTVLEYCINTNQWVVVPKMKKIYGTDGQSGNYQLQSEENYLYDNGIATVNGNADGNLVGNWLPYGIINLGILKAVYKNVGTPASPHYIYSAQYGYNGIGVMTTVRDPLGRDTITEYNDVYKVYPIRIIDPKGFSTSIIYNSLMQPASIIDCNNTTTSFEYDAFGRTTKVIKPGDSSACPTIQTIYQDTAFPRCVITKQRKVSGAEGTLDTYSYMDGFGRTIQTKQTGADSSHWMTEENWDYVRGNAHYQEVRVPYTSTTPLFNRNRTAQIPANSTTKIKTFLGARGSEKNTYFPDGNSVSAFTAHFTNYSIDVNGYGEISTVDGLGNVIQHNIYSDKNFQALYRSDLMFYDTGSKNCNKVIEDIGHSSVVSTYSYDLAGRLIMENNPDKGTSTYIYSDASDILVQKGNVTVLTCQYDLLGRVQKKKYSGNNDTKEENYFYDEGGSAAFANGRLTRVVDSSGTNAFKYDVLGRMITNYKAIIGSGKVKNSYCYDAVDRVISMTYPGGEVVQKTYDNAGRLVQVGNPDQPGKYLQNMAYNDRDQLTESVFGNGTANRYSYYDAAGNFGLHTYQANQADGTVMQYHAYDYDKTGNIVKIDSGDSAFNQNFSYDFLNRLTGQNNASFAGGSSCFAYDAINNILQKNGVNYFYNASKPHAVTGTSASPAVYKYDSEGNMVSKGIISPVGYWKFDEGSGSTIADSSGSSLNGTIANGVWTTGVQGKAVSFNGSSSYANCGNPASLNITSDITIEAWVKTPGSAYNTFIVEKFNGDSYPYPGYGLALAQNGSLMFWNGNLAEGWNYSSTPMRLVDNQWHHIAITGNKSTGQGAFYIDGVQDGTFHYTGIPDNLSERMYIGSYKAGIQQVFNGMIDEVAVFNKELSSSDIQSHYQQKTVCVQNSSQQNVLPDPALISCWKFDDNGSEGKTSDSSGNGYNAWLNNGARFLSDWGINNCGNFSATSHNPNGPFLNAGNSSGLNITNDITITALVYGNGYPDGVILSKGPAYGSWAGITSWNGFSFETVGGQLQFWIGNRCVSSTGIFPSDSRWHSVTVSASKSAGIGTFYVDGTARGTFPYSGIANNLNNNLNIGGWSFGPPSHYYFTGCIDEVSIWKKALSQSEVQNNFKQGSVLVTEWGEINSARVYLNMDDGSPTLVKDISDHGNYPQNGNINGAVYLQNKGVNHSGCYQFSWKQKNNIMVPGSVWLENGMTVSVWVYPTAWDNAFNGRNRIMTRDGVFSLCCENGIPDMKYNTYYGDMREIKGTSALSLNQWHNVVVTYYPSMGGEDHSKVKLYIDGALTATDQFPSNDDGIMDNGNPIAIGELSGMNEGFTGLIDNAVVYTSDKDASFISAIYNRLNNPSKDIALDIPLYNYGYDAANNLVSISGAATASYMYDYTGSRVKKVEGNSTTYTFSPNFEIENGKTNKYYFAGGKAIAENQAGTLIFFHHDNQDSISRISSASGVEIKHTDFMPYGEFAYGTGAGMTSKYQYTGQEKDSTGLYYYGARFYDPELGRFLSLDPMGDNYCYANNNPIMFNDPTGMSSLLQNQYNAGDSDGGGGSGGYSTLPRNYFDTGSDYNPMPGLNGMLNTTTGAYYSGAGATIVSCAGSVVRGAGSGLVNSLSGSYNYMQTGWENCNIDDKLNAWTSSPNLVVDTMAGGLKLFGIGMGLSKFASTEKFITLYHGSRFDYNIILQKKGFSFEASELITKLKETGVVGALLPGHFNSGNSLPVWVTESKEAAKCWATSYNFESTAMIKDIISIFNIDYKFNPVAGIVASKIPYKLFNHYVKNKWISVHPAIDEIRLLTKESVELFNRYIDIGESIKLK